MTIHITKQAIQNLNKVLQMMDIEDNEPLRIDQRGNEYLRLVVPEASFELIWNPIKEKWDYKVLKETK